MQPFRRYELPGTQTNERRMNLDQAQKQRVAEWIEEGLKLSEIQKKLVSEFGVSMTYMEVRFLLDDLKLKPKEPQPPVALAPLDPQTGIQAAVPPAKPAGGIAESDAQNKSAPAGVSMTIDQVARPGALVSGQVTFSDGNSAAWYLDQMGRFGLTPQQPGYRPSQEDLLTFQAEL